MTIHKWIMMEEPVSNRGRGVAGDPGVTSGLERTTRAAHGPLRAGLGVVLSRCSSYVSRSLPVGSNVPSAGLPFLVPVIS